MRAVGWIGAVMALSASGQPAVLLDEDFDGYRAGLFSSTVGAHTEYHYLPEAAAKGHWAVTSFRSEVESQRAWRIVAIDGDRAMAQVWQNKYVHCRPMIVAGDVSWRDYTATVRFTPESGTGRAGAAFRYVNDRCYYFAGVAEGEAVLLRVRHETAFRVPDEVVLDRRPLAWTAGDDLAMTIRATGSSLSVRIGDVELAAGDAAYPEGKIALTADFPAVFASVRVEAAAEEAARIAEAARSEREAEAGRIAANPAMTLWRKLDLKDFGVGRNVRFGDLDGDGALDVLFGQVRHHGPKDRNSEVGCLTAMTFEGERLWQIGEADPWKTELTNDVAFQIHDIDGDGRSEVIYVRDMAIVVADGRTGETIRSVPTPATPPNTRTPYNKFPRILGDALLFCDLRGTGRDGDFVIKDRYLSLWAFDENLNELWHAQCTTGHYPYAYDTDGDGKDEVMAGYTLFDHDGSRLWTLDAKLKDHADGVAILPFREGEAPKLFCAASDEGAFMTDMAGNVLVHHRVGHVQNPAIGDFRPDLPGMETITANFWGNQGIIHFYDADGAIYHSFEPAQHGSMCMPVNWTGEPGPYWILSANVDDGGLFDGYGRRVLRFPADGHPDMCNAALDLTGDARDEIVVWDASEMWVYTQADSPKAGARAMTRNPLYNYSNYQTTVVSME